MTTQANVAPRRGFVTRVFRGVNVGIREFDFFTIAGLLCVIALLSGALSQIVSRAKAQWNVLPANGAAWTTNTQPVLVHEPFGHFGEPKPAGRVVGSLQRVEITGRTRNGKFVQVAIPAEGRTPSSTVLLETGTIVLKDPAPRLIPQTGAIFGGAPGRTLVLMAAPSEQAREIVRIPHNQILLLRADVEARSTTADLPPIGPGWKLVENIGPQGTLGQFYLKESSFVSVPAGMRPGTISPGLTGIWRGGGQCMVAGRFGLTVTISETTSGIGLRAIVQRQGEQPGQSGSYRQTATFDPRTRRLSISHPSWEQRTPYYLPLGSVTATVSADWKSLAGKIDDPTCGQIELARTQ